MSAAVAIAVPIILEVAKKVGAPLIKGVMEKYLGGAAGEIAGDVAGTIIDTVAEKAGVAIDELPDLPRDDLEAAVTAAEPETAEIVLARVEQQREANRLMLAEMEQAKKDGAWTWAWRPATMWLVAFLWFWSLVLVPVVNAMTGADVPYFVQELIWLTGIYLALYMGGHTIKSGLETWKEARTRR